MSKARDLANAADVLDDVSATELGHLDGVTSAIQTQLNQKPEFVAGKNKIINGDFNINQRAFTSTTSSAVYTFDRWKNFASDGTVTCSAEAFTPGTAPVTGYESANFFRIVTTGQTATSAGANITQHIEDVRTFANQTITISFWAKAGSGTPKIAIELRQNFGSGGSPSSAVGTYVGQVTLSTSWARYSVTIAVPSISGKTIGTTANTSNLLLLLWTSAGSDLNARTGSLGIQSATIDIWGVQAEDGSVATAFQTATGTIQGELAACQRYYFRKTYGTVTQRDGAGLCQSTTSARIFFPFPVEMRIEPTALEQNGTAGDYSVASASNVTCSGVVTYASANKNGSSIEFPVASGLVAGNAAMFRNVNTNAYLAWSAEL
jgi:hypothetical protein